MKERQTNRSPVHGKLRRIMGRFPRGLDLSSEDLAFIGWLHLYEQESGALDISEARMRWLISEAAEHLSFDSSLTQPTHLVQKLMRQGILRMALAGGERRGYRLTCLGQAVARNLIEDVDYGSEQLNALFTSALNEVRAAGAEGHRELLRYLRHVFLGAIRENIEYKLIAIEEDLEARKQEVKRTYSGQSQTDFEDAIQDIEYCRKALTELVDAVQESSACVAIEALLHDQMLREPAPELYEALEQSMGFVYVLRSQVDTMLKDVVQFIRDCMAYRSLAFTVDSRERLCRIQEKILTYGLDKDLRMPVLASPRIPRVDINWSRTERERPVTLDLERLLTLEGFRPPAIPPIEPEWKAPFLDAARSEWPELAVRGGIDLGQWLEQMVERMPQVYGSPYLALWFLSQDWPQWSPPVSLIHLEGRWIPLGDDWMMKAVKLVGAE